MVKYVPVGTQTTAKTGINNVTGQKISDERCITATFTLSMEV